MSMDSPILYGLLCHGRVALCDCYLVKGNYDSLCQSALDHIEASPIRRAKKKNRYKDKEMKLRVCVYSSEDIHYMAVDCKAIKKAQVYALLIRVEELFHKKGLHNLVPSATPYSLLNDFRADLRSVLVEEVAPGKDFDETTGSRVGGTVSERAREARKAVDKRGVKLNEVEKRTETMKYGAVEFGQLATQLKNSKKAGRKRDVKLNESEKHSEAVRYGEVESDPLLPEATPSNSQSSSCCSIL